jgi:hypothetical protein
VKRKNKPIFVLSKQTNMKYVSFEVAKALKATGYNEPTKAYYRTMIVGKEYIFHETEILIKYNELQDDKRDWFAAPTIDDAFRWLLKNNKNPVHNFNATHPELLFESEIFLMNIKEGEDPNWLKPSHCCGVRTGNIAYDNCGEVVKNMVPVFGKLKK